MKSMREMISLMEGVTAIPGIGPSAGGRDESDMQTTSTIGRDDAYGEFDSTQGQATEESSSLDTYRARLNGLQRLGTSSREYGEGYAQLLRDMPDEHEEHVRDQNRRMWTGNKWEGDSKSHRSAVDEKSSSEKQARFMAACAHGADYDSCPPDNVSKEFNQADKGTKQLSKAMKNESVPAVDSCQQTNPETADVACAMEGVEMNPAVEQAMASFDSAVMTYGMDPEEAYDRIAQTLNDEDLGAFRYQLEALGKIDDAAADDTGFNDSGFDEPRGPDDFSDDADALASAGHGSDEDYGGYMDQDFDESLEESFDLQNGYNNRHDACGDDYFPDGADGPVVDNVGPSGARHGDNPEQKKMQIAETHKELVYAYRNFLKESSSTIFRK